MSQQIAPRVCTRCGNSLVASERFCSNCGATTDLISNNPTAATPSPQLYSQPAWPKDPTLVPPPPPPPDSFVPMSPMSSMSPQFPPYTQYPSQGQVPSYYSTPSPISPPPPSSSPTPVPDYAALPAYAQAPKRSRMGIISVVSILLVIVLLVSGFFLLGPKLFATPTTGNQSAPTATGIGQNPNGNNGGPIGNGNPTPTTSVSGTTSEQLNLTVTYSSVQITITSVQQADTFSDDSLAFSQHGLVRINFKESNQTTSSAYYSYTESFRLLLPDGASQVAPLFEQNFIGPEQAVNRTNWVDFPVGSTVDLSKLTLRLGTQAESQMDIPLNPNANVSKYTPQTKTLNAHVSYAGLDWTVTTVTSSLSADGKQAGTGKRLITVKLKVDNHTQNEFFGFNYLRLKSGDTTSSPTLESESKAPNTVAAGQTNVTGYVTFEMPENSTSLTLIFLAMDQVAQQQITFQL